MANKLTYSVSLVDLDLTRLESELSGLGPAGCGEIHAQILDGTVVPDIPLGFEVVRAAKTCCSLPCHAHLLTARPDLLVDRAIKAGCDWVTVQVETCPHLHRVVTGIRDAGASPGVAIYPATPLTKLDYALAFVDRVLVMTVEPGLSRRGALANTFERVRILRENLAYRELRAQIAVSGDMTPQHAALFAKHGAQVIILDEASGFGSDETAAIVSGFKADVEARIRVL